MKIIFYSNYCKLCIALLGKIKENNYESYFKMICIDNIDDLPKNITVVPTILDDDLDGYLEGDKARDYILNLKFFNNPTNNIEFTKNGPPARPIIEEDIKANASKSGSGFIYLNQETESKNIEKEEKNNFDRVFDMKGKNIQVVKKPTNSKEITNSKEPTNSNEEIPKPTDEKLNKILTERNTDDKRIQTLLKLRKSR
jgi:hypothetical protein